MSLISPAWISHDKEGDGGTTKRSTIFSLHVHPDGSRLATAGLDSKIRIWATAPILDPALEADTSANRLLCTLSRHTGSVLVVRWSASGRFLASGSDDTIALIWDLDPTGLSGGASFGAAPSEVNIEAWRPHRRLAAHESDVVDLAWSQDLDDTYLATVGLDSAVYIWAGARPGGNGAFERLRRIDSHAGFVKGVVWDPLGKLLATASDDKTLRIWRIEDWGEEASVGKPFETSPSTVFFTRPSWSPDGAHVLCANAMSGPVFVAAVAYRQNWNSDISLVGHENSIAVTAFSPRLFKNRNPGGDDMPCTVMALGSLDQSVSVWITGQPRPLLVARDVFERQVMDLSWSSDGLTLYACSADGRIAAFIFTEEFLAPLASDELLEAARESWGWQKTSRAASQASLAPSLSSGTMERPNVLMARKRGGVPPASKAGGLPPPAAARPARLVQVITRDAKGRRRIRPTLLNGDESSMDSGFASSRDEGFAGQMDVDMQLGGSASELGFKRPAEEELAPEALRAPRQRDVGRTLGGELARSAAGPAVALRGAAFARGGADVAQLLPTPALMSVYRRERPEGTLEARNSDGTNPTQLVQTDPAGRVLWLDVLPAPVLLATSTSLFAAAALDDGSLVLYTSKGRRIGVLALDSPCFRLEAARGTLVALTTAGMLHRWDVPADRELHRPVSLRGLLAPGGDALLSFWVHTNGAPVLLLRNETAYTLDARKLAWVCIASGWWADASPLWDVRGRRAAGGEGAAAREPVKALEVEINDLVLSRSSTGQRAHATVPPGAAGAEELAVSCALRHLETRMLAASLLDSPAEYRTHLLAYARKLADEGIRNQAEDLCKSLCGPVYYKPGMQETWEPTIVGLSKRDLLADVLKHMAKSRLLLGLVQTYQELLRAIAAP